MHSARVKKKSRVCGERKEKEKACKNGTFQRPRSNSHNYCASSVALEGIIMTLSRVFFPFGVFFLKIY